MVRLIRRNFEENLIPKYKPKREREKTVEITVRSPPDLTDSLELYPVTTNVFLKNNKKIQIYIFYISRLSKGSRKTLFQ